MRRFVVIFALWGLLVGGPGMVEAAQELVEKPIHTSVSVAPEYAAACYKRIVTSTYPDYGYSVCGTLTAGTWQKVNIACRNSSWTLTAVRAGPKIYSSGTRSTRECPTTAPIITSVLIFTGTG